MGKKNEKRKKSYLIHTLAPPAVPKQQPSPEARSTSYGGRGIDRDIAAEKQDTDRNTEKYGVNSLQSIGMKLWYIYFRGYPCLMFKDGF